MKKISFSFSAVAKLGVPPGKWFCLARTGLGYSEYSCCVCKLHQSVFLKHWERRDEEDWKPRIISSIDETLAELKYNQKGEGSFEIIRSRLHELLFQPSCYIKNSLFDELIASDFKSDIAILSDGPACLPTMVFPKLDPLQVYTNKSSLSVSELRGISKIHVGTSLKDIRVPQTKYIFSRKILQSEVPSHVKVIPSPTQDLMQSILHEAGIS
jgi:hypothetical protein